MTHSDPCFGKHFPSARALYNGSWTDEFPPLSILRHTPVQSRLITSSSLPHGHKRQSLVDFRNSLYPQKRHEALSFSPERSHWLAIRASSFSSRSLHFSPTVIVAKESRFLTALLEAYTARLKQTTNPPTNKIAQPTTEHRLAQDAR